ncbi:uncharacterized mitochondrial protein-like protein [Tanacetum coccineum]
MLVLYVLPGANTGGSSFVYLGGQIPIDASTLPNADLPIDPNMPDLEDDSNVFPNDGIFSGAYDDEDVGAEADFNNMDNTIDNRTNHKDHQNCLLACFLSQEEPKMISQALEDESWVEAMQEELLIVQITKVWILLICHLDKGTIGTKWGLQDRAIREKVYVHQPPGFVDPAHPNKVYKVIKALYGLHQAPRACQDKYVANILKKFDFCSIKTATTPIASNKPLVKDEDGVDVDVHVYRSMIGSLMYLTASRPDIMFVVCACARDSPFELEAFSDSDYGGASLDRKSQSGGSSISCRE